MRKSKGKINLTAYMNGGKISRSVQMHTVMLHPFGVLPRKMQYAHAYTRRSMMDKFFLLTYTCIGYDGFRHMQHGWFETEADMRAFVAACERQGKKPEIDMAIEILSCRRIDL